LQIENYFSPVKPKLLSTANVKSFKSAKYLIGNPAMKKNSRGYLGVGFKTFNLIELQCIN